MAKYKVKPNELPSEIAKKYGISPQSLLRANPGVTRFSPGMAIKIPNIVGGAGAATPNLALQNEQRRIGSIVGTPNAWINPVTLATPNQRPAFEPLPSTTTTNSYSPLPPELSPNLALTNEQRRMQTSTTAPTTAPQHSPRPPQLPAGWPRFVTNEQLMESGATPALMYQQGYRFDVRTGQWAFFVAPTPTTTSTANVINSQNYGYGTSASGRPLDKFGNEILPTNAQGKPKAARNAKGNLITHGSGRGGGQVSAAPVAGPEGGSKNSNVTWRT